MEIEFVSEIPAPNKANYTDLTGKIFNRLTVLGRDPDTNGVQWLCQCACNGPDSRRSVKTQHLKNGHTKSCGCHGREQRIKRNKEVARLLAVSRVGTKLHHLTAVEYLFTDKNGPYYRWICDRDANETIQCWFTVKGGNARSCGCLMLESSRRTGQMRAKTKDEMGKFQ